MEWIDENLQESQEWEKLNVTVKPRTHLTICQGIGKYKKPWDCKEKEYFSTYFLIFFQWMVTKFFDIRTSWTEIPELIAVFKNPIHGLKQHYKDKRKKIEVFKYKCFQRIDL